MKTLFALTAALLLSMSLLSAFLPGDAQAAEKTITVAEMTAIKKAADEAAAAAQLRVEKAKTEEEKSLAEELLEYARINAEVAAELLKTAQEGGKVDRKEAESCATIAKKVNKAAAAIAAGDVSKAGEMLDKIAEMESSLPTAANSAAAFAGLGQRDMKKLQSNPMDTDDCKHCGGADGKHAKDYGSPLPLPPRCKYCGKYNHTKDCPLSKECDICGGKNGKHTKDCPNIPSEPPISPETPPFQPPSWPWWPFK